MLTWPTNLSNNRCILEPSLDCRLFVYGFCSFTTLLIVIMYVAKQRWSSKPLMIPSPWSHIFSFRMCIPYIVDCGSCVGLLTCWEAEFGQTCHIVLQLRRSPNNLQSCSVPIASSIDRLLLWIFDCLLCYGVAVSFIAYCAVSNSYLNSGAVVVIPLSKQMYWNALCYVVLSHLMAWRL